MSVLPVATARSHLNLADLSHDDKLQTTIDAAEAVITQRCGPLAPTATTARVKGGGFLLMLPIAPAVSLTSVTPVGGTALTLGDLYLSMSAGSVSYSSGSTFSAGLYDVVYSAGRTTCPADLLMAVLELVRHMWETQRGPTRRPGSSTSDALANTLPGAAHTLPFRVSELIAPHVLHVVGA